MKTTSFNTSNAVASLAWALALLSASNTINAGTISQTPLFVTASLDPNIMFILDDSGSMNASYIPDTLCTSVSLRTTKRAYSSYINGLAYNPATTYSAPVDQNGVSLGDATFTAAWKDGYILPHPSVTGATAKRSALVNLSTQYEPTWSRSGTGCSDSNEYMNGGTAPSGTVAAYYYAFWSQIPSFPKPSACTGTADQQKADEDCYIKITVGSTVSPADLTPGTAAQQKQNFANWYSYYRTRIMTLKAGASRAFSRLDNTTRSPRVGYGRLNKSTSNTIDGVSLNTIERGVRAFTGTDRQSYFSWLFAVSATSSTPTRQAMDAAGRYFSNESAIGPWSTTPGISGGTLYGCRQSYLVLMTDGYWNNNAAPTSGAQQNNDGTTVNNMVIPNPGSTVSFTYTPVGPFKDNVSNSLADVAMYYWKRDICPSLANNVPISSHDPAFWQHMATYGIGLGVPTAIDATTAFNAISTSTTISWPDPQTSSTATSVVARIDDLLHAAVNGHGGFFNANDTDSFVTALQNTLSAITSNSRTSASAAAANSTSLQGDTLLYLAKFKPVDWYGILQAIPIDQTTGAINSLNPNWEASQRLPTAANRKIFTLNPSASTAPHGSVFQWANLTNDQKTYLNKLGTTTDTNGEKRLNWLRGDTLLEQGNPSGIFRKRAGLLGDIVNSDPTFVGITDYGYNALPGSEGTAYSSFRTTSSYLNRIPTLYVGANDGMLHGFDARKIVSSGDPGGEELFAYIPNVLFPELSKLTDPNYAHQYYVDGKISVGDAYFGSTWHTMLAGTTGAGGRAVFALDVTDPGNFGINDVLWEFTNTNDNNLGYTVGQPAIVRTNDEAHPWVALVANGYNSDAGHAVLFVLNAQTGDIIKKIDTQVGDTTTKNGLSSPLAVDTNGDKKIDAVYAGDLYGNMWKFNFSATSSSTWDIAFKSSTGNNLPLFVACTTTGSSCPTANRQPITGKPNAGAVGSDQGGGLMVYFGTGKYFEVGDGTIGSSPQVQTFYGIWDQATTTVADRANLQEQTIIFEGYPTTVDNIVSPDKLRVVSKNPVCYAATSPGCTSASPLKHGWALNLLQGGVTAQGERVVSNPLVRRGFVIFSTMIPDPDPCTGGGKGWLMEIDAYTGGMPSAPPFDVNDDNQLNGSDQVVINGNTLSASGVDLGIGIHNTPTVVEATTVDYKYVTGSSGERKKTEPGMPQPTVSATPLPAGRNAWRQLR